MKLGYLVSHHPTSGHGFMLREIAALRRLGFDVSVASIQRPKASNRPVTENEARELGTTFYVKDSKVPAVAAAHFRTFLRHPTRYLKALAYSLGMGHFQPRRTLWQLFYFIEAIVAGDWMIRRDVAHLHVHFASTVGLLTVKVFPLTMSVTFHGPEEFDDPRGFRLADKVRASRFTIAISAFARSQLMRHVAATEWSRILVVPLGVSVKVQPPPFHPAPSPLRIVCAARLAPVKGHDVLLHAFADIRRRHPDTVLHLAGDGQLHARLQETAARLGLGASVVFEGLMEPHALLALYGQCHLLALASFAEGVPVVLMEAMAMEIPCIATWVGGVPELIDDGVDGLLVPPGDVHALSNAIGRLIQDPELRRRLGRAGRPKVAERYNLETNAAKLAAVFREQLTRHL